MFALVGRDREIAAVRRFVGGAGGGLMVVGEAGIGKSRLLAEVAAVARARTGGLITGRWRPGVIHERPSARDQRAVGRPRPPAATGGG